MQRCRISRSLRWRSRRGSAGWRVKGDLTNTLGHTSTPVRTSSARRTPGKKSPKLWSPRARRAAGEGWGRGRENPWRWRWWPALAPWTFKKPDLGYLRSPTGGGTPPLVLTARKWWGEGRRACSWAGPMELNFLEIGWMCWRTGYVDGVPTAGWQKGEREGLGRGILLCNRPIFVLVFLDNRKCNSLFWCLEKVGTWIFLFK